MGEIIGVDPELFEGEPKYEYETLIVDADTPVFRSSRCVEEDYILVKHKKSGKIKEFRNKTSYGIRGNKIIALSDKDITENKTKDKEGHPYKWLAWANKKLEDKSKPPYTMEDFEVTFHNGLLPDMDHIDEGVMLFDVFVGKLKRTYLAENYKLLIGGDGNYRYDLAESAPYKGDRPDKPLLFLEIRDAILSKYRKKVEVVNGREVDDMCAVYGRENAEHYAKTGKWKYCIALLDKDLKMIYSPQLNYDAVEKGVHIPTELECSKYYGKQLLCGDKAVDNIMGLPDISPELREKYGVRKGKSVGDTTAAKFIESCVTIKEVFERVVEAYRDYYGDVPFDFTDFRGDTYKSTWMDRLQEVAMLIYMNDYDNPLDYHIKDHLDKYEVEY